MRCRDEYQDLRCLLWPEPSDVRGEFLPARPAVRIQVSAVPPAQEGARRQEPGARIGVIARESRFEVDGAVEAAQVFWTTMFGNLDVMSRCSSAIFTAQRRAILR